MIYGVVEHQKEKIHSSKLRVRRELLITGRGTYSSSKTVQSGLLRLKSYSV